MNDLRARSRAVVEASPFAPGARVLAGDLAERFPGSFRGFGPGWASGPGLNLIKFWQYPPYHRPVEDHEWARYVHRFFSQVNTTGEDFGAVPVPEGQTLQALGWLEDQSCWWGSLVQAARHPALASVRGGRVPEPVDGSIVRWPAGGEVLLRRAGSGAAALVVYPLGAGQVVVGTLYGDWAEANGGEPWDGYRVLRDLLFWAFDPGMERPVCRVGEPCSPAMALPVRNTGGEDADRVVVRNEYNVLGTPAEQTIRLPWREFAVNPGESAQFDEVFTVPGDWQGRADAELYFCYPHQDCWQDGQENHGSRSGAWAHVGLPLARAAAVLGTPELVPGPALRVPVTVRSTGPRALDGGRLSVWIPGGASQEMGPFTLAPHGEESFEVELPVAVPQGSGGALTVSLRARVRQDGVPQVDQRTSSWVSYRTDLGFPVIPAIEAGQQGGTVSVRVANPSNIPASFDLAVAAPAVDLEETRHLELAAGQELQQVFQFQVPEDLAYGSYPVVVTLSDGAVSPRSATAELWYPAPLADVALHLPEEHPHAGGQAEVGVTWAAPAAAAPLPALLEVTVPAVGFSESRPVTLLPDQEGAETVTVVLPPDTGPGDYPVRVTLTGARGLEIAREAALFVPWEHATVERVAAHPVAGGSVTYRAGNDGGAAAQWQARWRLVRGSMELASEALSLSLAPGETVDLTFDLPADLASGGYVSSFCSSSACVTENLEVSGATASLHLATSQPVYRPWQTILGTATVVNGGWIFPPPAARCCGPGTARWSCWPSRTPS